tara:strand:+ start:2203 stop:2493 length:291 start_codon:yes stop_codon:yes gene_type:complete
MYTQTKQNDSLYRLKINKATKQVSVLRIAMESLDDECNTLYDTVDSLPNWLQEGVAILSMTSAEPPTQEVIGIGRRIDEDTYWLYEPDGELVSTNT